jgi:hypothetical protein
MDSLDDEDSDSEIDQLLQQETQRVSRRLWKFWHLSPHTTGRILHVLGSNDTSFVVTITVGIATAITAVVAATKPRLGECAPVKGDSDFWAAISASITLVCSCYYLLVPYFRGNSKWPVRKWFYLLWATSATTGFIAPFIYLRSWETCLCLLSASGITQCIATAFLFWHFEGDRKGRMKSARRVHNDFEMTTRTNAEPEASPTNIDDQMGMTTPAVGNDEPRVNPHSKLKRRRRPKKGK